MFVNDFEELVKFSLALKRVQQWFKSSMFTFLQQSTNMKGSACVQLIAVGNKMKLLGVKHTFKKSVKRETFPRHTYFIY